MSEYNVEFYTKSNGEKPVKEFLLGLEPKMRAMSIPREIAQRDRLN